MAGLQLSSKRLQIDRATATIVIVVAIASFLTVFSLIAARALLSQRSYQARVIEEKEKAKKQIEENQKALEKLVAEYQAFVEAPVNVLGGNPSSDARGERDGDNPRIILDALPSKYDFPAWASSVEKLLKEGNYRDGGFSGNDDEVVQSEKQADSNPQPIEMPFQVSLEASYQDIQGFISKLERSIRPIRIETFTIEGSEADITMSITAKTYYQPGKSLDFKTKEVQ